MNDQPQTRRKWRRWVVAVAIAVFTMTATPIAFVFGAAVALHWTLSRGNLEYSIDNGLTWGIAGAIPILILAAFAHERVGPPAQLIAGTAWAAMTGTMFCLYVAAIASV